jgi:hypothetical protein
VRQASRRVAFTILISRGGSDYRRAQTSFAELGENTTKLAKLANDVKNSQTMSNAWVNWVLVLLQSTRPCWVSVQSKSSVSLLQGPSRRRNRNLSNFARTENPWSSDALFRGFLVRHEIYFGFGISILNLCVRLAGFGPLERIWFAVTSWRHWVASRKGSSSDHFQIHIDTGMTS